MEMFKYPNGAGALNRYRYFRSLLNSLTCISRRNRWKESFAAVCFGGVQILRPRVSSLPDSSGSHIISGIDGAGVL